MIPPFARILQILGIDLSKLKIVNRPIKFKFVIFPDESIFFDNSKDRKRVFSAEYADTINEIRDYALKKFSPMSSKKFYFFHGRNQIGEERVANYFHSKGYEVIRPERLPFDEQLNILANCQQFASSLGSISHNTLFVRDKTESVFIPRVENTVTNQYQRIVNELRNLNAYYINSHLSFFKENDNGPYCYIVSENLRKHFGDKVTEKYTDEDLSAFLAYVRYAKIHGLKENAGELKYLGKILPEIFEQLKSRKDLLQKFGISVN